MDTVGARLIFLDVCRLLSITRVCLYSIDVPVASKLKETEPSPKKTKKMPEIQKILNTKNCKGQNSGTTISTGNCMSAADHITGRHHISSFFWNVWCSVYDIGCQNISSHIMSSKGLNTHIMVVMHIFGTHLLFMLMGYKMTHTPTTTNKCSSWLVCDSFYVMSTTTNSLSSLFINHIF